MAPSPEFKIPNTFDQVRIATHPYPVEESKKELIPRVIKSYLTLVVFVTILLTFGVLLVTATVPPLADNAITAFFAYPIGLGLLFALGQGFAQFSAIRQLKLQLDNFSIISREFAIDRDHYWYADNQGNFTQARLAHIGGAYFTKKSLVLMINPMAFYVIPLRLLASETDRQKIREHLINSGKLLRLDVLGQIKRA